MSKKKSHLSDDDRMVWKAVTSGLTPHKKTAAHQKKRKHKEDDTHSMQGRLRDSAETSHKKNTSKKWQSVAHTPAPKPAHKHTHSELPVIASDVLSNIKSKKRKIDARLDLHGMTQEVAHRKAISFITQAHTHGFKTVLVITGKGSAAGSEGILQRNLPRWLHADASVSKHIAGINAAPRDMGGAGAYVITLKKR